MLIRMENCTYCSRLPKLLKEKSPFIVHEFKNSLLLVGDHQTYPGYCVLVLKDHVKELFDLKESTQIEVYKELVAATQKINSAYSADKMNVSNYGNMTPHQHWHIFPRKKSDANWPQPPWTLMESFEKNKTSESQAQNVTTILKKLF